jgi:Na+-transporting methylmalonyl-CoA/oxaloacetate decarboxylase gamma subunit
LVLRETLFSLITDLKEVRIMSIPFVGGLGIGTVSIGLICIIILCKIVSAICIASDKKKSDQTTTAAPSAPAGTIIENRQELIAAISAAVAEELGKDVSAIRILSFKKI